MKGGPATVWSVVATLALAGCLGGVDVGPTDEPLRGIVTAQTAFVHDALGRVLNLSDYPIAANLSSMVYSVGQPGPEPSVGVTSNGYVFFQALEKTYRSADHGRTWQRVAGPLTAMGTSDPYLWVDPTTDRVFQLNMGIPFGGRGPLPPGTPVPTIALALFCSHLAWSDDYGATWLANPIACGPVPFNDHEKLATGPWTEAFTPLNGNAVYPNAVYYAYNKVAAHGVTVPGQELPETLEGVELGGWMAVSLDGGATFPIANKMFDPGCAGSLHGNIAVAPDGTLYVPTRFCPAPRVAWSRDNGLTWQTKLVGESVGVPDQQKNPEIAVDQDNNVYLVWTGKDNRLWMSTSRDRAATWTPPIAVSPPQVGSTIWPVAVAGSAGRVGVAYVGTQDNGSAAWEVGNETRWHLYYTYTLDALAANATFVTLRATHPSDPVQRGTICVDSSKCKYGNRNLLDFIDLTLDADGRPYVAFADGCTTPQCLRAGATPLDSRDRGGAVMVLLEGPSLFADTDPLAPFE